MEWKKLLIVSNFQIPIVLVAVSNFGLLAASSIMPSTRSYRSFVSDDKGQIKSITCEIDGKDQVQISTTIVKTQQSGDNCSSCIHKLGCLRDCSSEAGIVGRLILCSYIIPEAD